MISFWSEHRRTEFSIQHRLKYDCYRTEVDKYNVIDAELPPFNRLRFQLSAGFNFTKIMSSHYIPIKFNSSETKARVLFQNWLFIFLYIYVNVQRHRETNLITRTSRKASLSFLIMTTYWKSSLGINIIIPCHHQ